MDFLRQIAGQVKAGRQRRGWSQVQLAAHAGLSLVVVQGVEQGIRLPNVRSIQKMIGALGGDPVFDVVWDPQPPSLSAEVIPPPMR